jgi:hypothetical protein
MPLPDELPECSPEKDGGARRLGRSLQDDGYCDLVQGPVTRQQAVGRPELGHGQACGSGMLPERHPVSRLQDECAGPG